MAPKHWMIIWTLRRYLFRQLCVWIYRWWMYQHWFCEPLKNQLNFKYVLTQFAESRSLCSWKSAIHKVVLKTQQYYRGPFVDALMLLFTDTKELIFTKSIRYRTCIFQMRGRGIDRLSYIPAVSEGACGSAKTWTYTLSASIQHLIPELSHSWAKKIKMCKTWGIWTALQVYCNSVDFK